MSMGDIDFVERLFGPIGIRVCLNCGEKFNPVETNTYYTCSDECGAEAARILNEQRPLFPKEEDQTG
jgi:DNA-directed RNA polymerase subunit RPC12/RpoP